MNRVYIYILIDPKDNKVKYVGKTCSVSKRYSAHINDKRKSHKRSWIVSLAKEGLKPIIEVIDEVSKDNWQLWEQHYISLYKSWGFKLTNHPLRLGGEGFNKGNPSWRKGIPLTLREKEHLRQINLGKVQSKETIEKRVKSIKEVVRKSIEEKGFYISTQHKESLRKSRLGKCVSRESIKKRTATRKEKGFVLTEKRKLFLNEWHKTKAHKLTKEDREKSHLLSSKVVEQYTLDNVKIAEFKSISEAKRKTGIITISDCVQQRQKTAGGFIFRFKA